MYQGLRNGGFFENFAYVLNECDCTLLPEYPQSGKIQANDVHDEAAEAYELNDIDNTKADERKPIENGDNNNSNLQIHGLSVVTAAVFIIGEICGAGVVAFPAAMSKMGVIGGKFHWYSLSSSTLMPSNTGKFA